MKDLPYFRFFTTDWLADQKVLEMTPIQEHAYFRLILYCWQEGQIPSEVGRLARLCKQTPEAMAQIWSAIKDRFRPCEGGYTHKRVEAERAYALRMAALHRENGRKGAETRYGRKREPSSGTSARSTQVGTQDLSDG